MSFRWAILAAGTFSQASYTALAFGLAVLAPALRARYGISLTEAGVVLAAPAFGSIGTLYAWGRAADRASERAVAGAGLAAAAACVAGAAFAGSFPVLVVCLLLAGALGASVNAASGRTVMSWFDVGGRGLALGIRQTAVPIAGMVVAVALPPLSVRDDPRPALLALAGGLLAGAAVGATMLRKPPGAAAERPAVSQRPPIRDRRIWRLSVGSAVALAPQACLVGFLVLFLHERRGFSTASAAAVLAVVNALGIGARIGAGRWSDLAGSRLGPLRRIALVAAGLVAGCAALVSGPLILLVPALVLMGATTISWNGLSYAAAAEAAGHARSGSAIGLQQTALAAAGTIFPVAFGTLVAVTSWRVGFAVVALFPLAGRRLLAGLPG